MCTSNSSTVYIPTKDSLLHLPSITEPKLFDLWAPVGEEDELFEAIFVFKTYLFA
jgi:hypothetical protein